VLYLPFLGSVVITATVVAHYVHAKVLRNLTAVVLVAIVAGWIAAVASLTS